MRRVILNASVAGVEPSSVYSSVIEFERFAELAPHVQSAVVHRTVPESTGRSSWELDFRSGVLRWTEEELFRPELLVVEFSQDHGDFDTFAGHWLFRPTEFGTDLHFEVDFDFGISSLEGILDPIAERVIRETVAWTVVGMFDRVELLDARDVGPVTEDGARPTEVKDGTQGGSP